jgi:putative ATP-dependent endonuclease of OLD family
LFAKALLLFEGQTEEIAMPIFYNKHFGRLPFEDGLTLVSVGGNLYYSPFLKFPKFLRIPVFILSDGDNDTESRVKSQISSVYENLESVPLYVLPNNSDFEQFLFDAGYQDEILTAIDKVKKVDNYIDTFISDLDGQKGKNGIRDYNGVDGKFRAIVDCMRGDKTEFPYDIAINIVESGKALPDKLTELFNKISETLNLKI